MSDNIDPVQYPSLNEDETSQSEAKYWIFTQFYYDQKIEFTNPDNTKEMITREESIQRFAANHCSYLTYGREKATTTLTPHLQGCLVLRIKKRYTFIKNNSNNGIHLKKMKSCLLANIIYCHKEKDWWTYKADNFTEPKKPKTLTGKKYIDRCNEAIQKAKYGNILDIDADILIGNLKNLQQIKYLEISKDVELNLLLGTKFGNYFQNHFLWLKGKTGTLKSYNTHKIGEILFKWLCKYNDLNNLPLPNANIWRIPYIKDLNKWFQNYCFEKIMIIEEADLTFCKNNVSRFKRWLDQYAFPGEFKGGDVGLIRPEFIIITSNFSLQDCFTQEGMDYEKDYLPMQRRVMEIDLDKKGYIIWPNLKLLTIEYNSKQTAKEYDQKFTENMYDLQEKLFDNLYTKEKITDPNKIRELFEGYTKYVDLEQAEQILNENQNMVNKPTTNQNKPSTSKPSTPEKSSFMIINDNENLYQTPNKKRTIDITIPETPIKKTKKDKSSSPNLDSPTKLVLERQNAIIIDSQEYKNNDINCIDCNNHSANKENPFCLCCNFVECYEQSSQTKPICRTCKKSFDQLTNGHCSECTYNLMKVYILNHPNTFDIQETQLLPESPSLESTPSTPDFDPLPDEDLDDIFKNAKNNSEQNVPQLSNSQETQPTITNIPQFDGADDYYEEHLNKKSRKNNNDEKDKTNTYFKDGNGNIWASIKQKQLIESKIKECQNINKTIISLKGDIKYGTDFMIRKNKQTQVELLTLKKQKIIKEFKLNKYNWIDDDTYIDPNICHYCNSGVLNQCSCFPVYLKDLSFKTLHEKNLWRDRMNQGLEVIKPINKEIKSLVQKINNKNTTLSELEDLSSELNWKNVMRDQHIKNYHLQNVLPNKIYPDKCDYCNLDCKRICECSGSLTFYDKNGKPYDKNKSKWPIDDDEAFDQWQEQDRHSDEF